MTEGSWVPKTWAAFPTARLSPLCTQAQEELQALSQILFLFRASIMGPVHTQPCMACLSRAQGQGNSSSMQEWNEVWTKQLAVSNLTWTASHVLQKPGPYTCHTSPLQTGKNKGPQLLYSMEFEKWLVVLLYKHMSNAECKTSIFSVNITKEKSKSEEC